MDPILEAERALDAGTGPGEVCQRYAVHAVRAGRVAAFDNLLASFDQDTGRLALLDYLGVLLDGQRVVLASELCSGCRAKALRP